MPGTHLDFTGRWHPLLPPLISWGLTLACLGVSQTWITSNLDNQLEGDPNLHTVLILAALHKNNDAHTPSFSPLLGDGDKLEWCTRPSRCPSPGAYISFFKSGVWLLEKKMPSTIIGTVVMYVWDKEWTFWGNRDKERLHVRKKLSDDEGRINDHWTSD